MNFEVLTENIPVHPQADKHPIVYVFSIGENHYFQFANGQNMYYERFMAAQDRFMELESGITSDYLDMFLNMLEEYLNKGQLTDAAVLVFNTKQRREWLPRIEHLYNICSVWFFDQHESPFVYDNSYAYKKIDIWQKHREALAFFLQTDMQKFFPSFHGLEERTLAFTRKLMESQEDILNYHFKKLSGLGASDATINTIKSQAERLRSLKGSLA